MTPIKELCEGFPGMLITVPLIAGEDSKQRSIEEFGIYLNYVRKLGFEETPDYDFLRELFAKVMKNNGDIDDGVFDWNRLNGMYRQNLLNFVFTGHVSSQTGEVGKRLPV